ncbi:hypothetical protein AB0J21_20645 [Streptomyces sp. NPDC049954]|uniref:hypothetical protein n=1 Tax=Streptomyces sp. NPDC049954 TaxID=3155779 RepID=UPI00342C898F
MTQDSARERYGTEHEEGLGALEPGTRQRAELRARSMDVAWTALCTVVLLWGVWTAVGVVRGDTAWAYCAVAWLLSAVVVALRVTASRRRARYPARR